MQGWACVRSPAEPDQLHGCLYAAPLLNLYAVADAAVLCGCAGGYAVLKGLQMAMRLPAEKLLPSFATLRDYGNTSCSTTW